MERLLDEAGQRAQKVERGAEAVEKTAAVAAEEGEVAVATEGVGGAFGYLGGLAEGATALAPTAGGAAYGLARGTGWVLENTLFRPQQGSEDAAVQDVWSANNLLAVWLPRSGAVSSRRSLPPPSFDQLARDIEAA